MYYYAIEFVFILPMSKSIYVQIQIIEQRIITTYYFFLKFCSTYFFYFSSSFFSSFGIVESSVPFVKINWSVEIYWCDV